MTQIYKGIHASVWATSISDGIFDILKKCEKYFSKQEASYDTKSGILNQKSWSLGQVFLTFGDTYVIILLYFNDFGSVTNGDI